MAAIAVFYTIMCWIKDIKYITETIKTKVIALMSF